MCCSIAEIKKKHFGFFVCLGFLVFFCLVGFLLVCWGLVVCFVIGFFGCLVFVFFGFGGLLFFFYGEGGQHWNRFPREIVGSHLWRLSKLNWTQPQATCSS